MNMFLTNALYFNFSEQLSKFLMKSYPLPFWHKFVGALDLAFSLCSLFHFPFTVVSNRSVMGFVGEYLWSEELVGTSKYKLSAAFEEIDELGDCLLVGFGAPGYGFLPKKNSRLC